METLSVYIPTDRRLALASGQPLPEHSRGAVLFADISGFTPLAAALAQELGSRRGAEELTRRLNDVFGALHAEVLRYAGSLISLGGDSITCWFDQRPPGADSDDPAGAARLALACALALQAAMGQFAALTTPGGTAVALQLKVAVAAGPARRLLVGNPRIQLCDVLAGAIMDRVAAAALAAGRGEVVATAEVAELLGAALAPREWRADDQGRRFAVVEALAQPAPAQPWPALPALPDEVTRDWLLSPVAERLARGEADFLSELRSAVPLFLKFASLDYDSDAAAGARLDAFVRWVQQLLARYEGTLLQLSMGDKGSHLYVIFGAPVAHEDDAARAVAAALELRQLPAELAFVGPVQIGISQGRVYVGAYGAADRRTYSVLGTDVNLAARLMEQAEPGQVVVTSHVAGVLHHSYDCASLGPREIKGHPEQVPLFAVQSRRAQAPAATPRRQPVPLVNRVAERAVFISSLAALRGGQRSTLLIEGEAGIGKSRLVAELLAQAELAGLRCLLGEGNAIEQSTPYYAWRAVLAGLLRPPGQPEELAAGDRDAWRSHVLDVLEAMQPSRLRLAPLLTAVLPLDLPDNDVTAQMSGDIRASNTNDLLVDLLAQQARQAPLVVVLEDAHWLDSASWTLAQLLSSQIIPLLLVISARPLGEPPPAGYPLIRQAPTTQRLLVEALATEEVDALVCQRLGVRQVPRAVSDLIKAKAEGHPFFSEELAYALRDAGLIRIVGDVCELAPGVRDLHAFDFPDTIEGVITSRVDRLPPTQQLTLKVASVIGRVFAYATLAAIYPVAGDLPVLVEQLNALNRVDITRMEASDPELTYIFKHVSAQEAVYSLLLFAQRQQLHQAVAAWYEQTHADNLAPFYGFLAYHWRRAGVPDKTVDYLERLGDQALNSGAYLEAARSFEEALALADEAPPGAEYAGEARRMAWRWKLGKAHYRLGQYDMGRRYSEQAMSWYDLPIPADQNQLLSGTLRQVALQFRNRVRPRPPHDAITPEAREVLETVSQIFLTLSPIYYFIKEQGLSMYAALRQVNHAEQYGPSLALAQSYGTMSIITGLFGLRPLAEVYSRLALAVGERLADQPLVAAHAMHSVGMYQMGAAQFAQARSNLTRAMEIYQHFGNRGAWRDCLVLLIATELGAGEFDRALQLVEQIPPALSEDDRALHHFWRLQWRAAAALRRGQADAALGLLGQAEGFLGRGNEEPVEVSYYGLLALAQLRQGQDEPALAAAQQALRLIGRTRGVPVVATAIDGYTAAAEVLLTLWEQAQRRGQVPRQLREDARRACGYLGVFAWFLPYGGGAALHQGWLLRLEGKLERAEAAWISGLADADRRGMRYEQARLHAALGQHMLADEQVRHLHLALARDVFAAMSLTEDLRQVEEALRGISRQRR